MGVAVGVGLGVGVGVGGAAASCWWSWWSSTDHCRCCKVNELLAFDFNNNINMVFSNSTTPGIARSSTEAAARSEGIEGKCGKTGAGCST